VGEWSGVNATTYQAFSMRMAEVKKPLGPGGPGAGRSTRADDDAQAEVATGTRGHGELQLQGSGPLRAEGGQYGG